MFLMLSYADAGSSGGLSPTGSSNGGCSSNTGQVYARSASFNNAFAIMYSWYMPKVSLLPSRSASTHPRHSPRTRPPVGSDTGTTGKGSSSGSMTPTRRTLLSSALPHPHTAGSTPRRRRT